MKTITKFLIISMVIFQITRVSAHGDDTQVESDETDPILDKIYFAVLFLPPLLVVGLVRFYYVTYFKSHSEKLDTIS